MPELRFPEFTEKWKSTKFADLFEFLSNNTLSRADLSDSGTVKNIHYGDVLVKFGDVVSAKDNTIPFVKYKSQLGKNTDYLKNGDIIIADTAEDDTVGKATEIRNISNESVVSGLHTIPCRAKESFAGGFLGYYLNSSAYRFQLYPLMQGIKVTSISKGNISKTELKFPSVNEQEKIAGMLSLVDKKIEAQRQIIDTLKLYKRGVFNSFFDIYSSSLKTCRIGDFACIFGGYAFKSSEYIENGDYKIITISAVTGERFICIDSCNTVSTIPKDLQDNQILEKGDILISLTGNVGRVSLVNDEMCLLNQRVAKLVPSNKNMSEYIYQILSSFDFEVAMINCGQGAAQKNIKNSDILEYQFLMPTDENLFVNFTNMLKLIDDKIRICTAQLELFNDQKLALLQKMFI